MSINDNVYAGDVLRKIARIINPKKKESKELIKLLIFRANLGKNAVGLAAPQLGINKAAFIYRVPSFIDGEVQFPELWNVVFNASYIPVSEEMAPMAEGCFSIPHLYSKSVLRYKRIKFFYQNLKGQWIENVVDGYEAQIIQHETDHLKGILYIDKIKDKGGILTTKELGEV